MRMAVPLALLVPLLGCAHFHRYDREDGPSTRMAWASASGEEIYAENSPSELRQRGWDAKRVTAPYGEVVHGPLWFEDPFEDKGKGHEEFRLGWEDGVALPYSLGRFLLNWMLLPVSAVVTPPGTPMESDGRLSRQLLDYDHDVQRVSQADRESQTESADGDNPVREPPIDSMP